MKDIRAFDSLDLEGLQNGLQNGDFTSEDLVYIYTAKIHAIDNQVHCMAHINPDARQIAIELDAERRNGKIRGPLHGIPILLKDTLITHDRMPTTAGSPALLGARFPAEATAATRLRAGGAILLGKTNLSEWGMARSPGCSSGWSALFGQTLGGFCEGMDPQGSSAGAAVAACYNLAGAGVGGETCGSILYPAQRNGVVGLKPTVGLVSRFGTVPLNPEQDSIGPVTRFVKDAAVVLGVIAGRDKNDEASGDIPFTEIPDYVAACKTSGLEGMRIAVPISIYDKGDSDPELGTAFRAAISKIKSLGGTIVDRDADFEKWRPSAGLRDDLHGDVLLREAYENFFGDLLENPHNIKTISDLIKFTQGHPDEHYDKFGATWFENARDAPGSSTSKAFLEVKARMEDFGEDVVRLLDRHDCDILICPSAMDLPLDLGRLPGITVPLGFYSQHRHVEKNLMGLVRKGPNVPYGITFAGRRFSDEKLIAAAYAFEQATMTVLENSSRLKIRPANGGSHHGREE